MGRKDDTAYLYSKNFSKATSEYALDLIGKEYYGLPNLGKAVFTGAGSVEDYLHGDSPEEIFLDVFESEFMGKVGKGIGKQVSTSTHFDINPEFTSNIATSIIDTYKDKKKNEEKKNKK